MSDTGRFPAPVYKDTVLAPLFEIAKRHHAAPLMRINEAHAVMLAERGILSREEASAILSALRGIAAGFDADALSYDGSVEDLFFHIEGRLSDRLGVDLAGKLHTGRSRNDIDHTIFKRLLKQRLAGLLHGLTNLVDTLVTVAGANRDTIVVAYTHGQPAQPTSFGHYLGALIEVLLRDLDRLALAGRDLDRCSMGAAAITTTGFDIDRARMADLLGFAEVQENSYGCIAACDYITGVYSALKILFINLGRFVQDLNQWTGFETGHLDVPDAYVQISSIMPQKRNPVPVEHLRLLLSTAAGHCDTIVNTMHNTPFTDMNDSEAEVQAQGYAAFETGGRALALLDGLIAAVRVDEARIRRHIDQSCITITELADSLVRVEDISFRQAHQVASRLARRVVERGESLSTVPFDDAADAFARVIGRPPELSEADFRRFVSPEHFIAVRERYGGPGPKALAASLKGYAKRLATHATALAVFEDRMAAADAALTALVDGHVGAATPATAPGRTQDAGE